LLPFVFSPSLRPTTLKGPCQNSHMGDPRIRVLSVDDHPLLREKK
jgi:hypothetical protein